jgi:hypothetical protein
MEQQTITVNGFAYEVRADFQQLTFAQLQARMCACGLIVERGRGGRGVVISGDRSFGRQVFGSIKVAQVALHHQR